jgi:transcription elongation factor GreB
MSRAFVKEADEGGRVEQLPDRPQSPHINYVTPAGLKALQDRAAELSAQRAAWTHQDGLESRQALSVVERDLRYFEERLKRAVRVEPKREADRRVHFGGTVEVRDPVGARSRFSIVGEDEADAAQGKISWVSPLATALLNAELGEQVVWRRPAGDKVLEIVTIESGEGA